MIISTNYTPSVNYPMPAIMKYSLKDFNDIIYNGFDIELPEDTITIITELAQQVGSPAYIKTPNFHKKTNDSSSSSSLSTDDIYGNDRRKKRNNRATEVTGDGDWETVRRFQITPVIQKKGINLHIDQIRSALNKLTDKNYVDQFGKIMDILNQVVDDPNNMTDNMTQISLAIFDIASNNRFYSKLYADLYSNLIEHFAQMKDIFEINLQSFLTLFEVIETADADKEYDKFCRINKDNEKRKALGLFIVNLTINKIIVPTKLFEITFGLLNQIVVFSKQENRKTEVDEMTENIAILYHSELFKNCEMQIDGKGFVEIITMFAQTKAKTLPSLSNKAIFKYMDLRDVLV